MLLQNTIHWTTIYSRNINVGACLSVIPPSRFSVLLHIQCHRNLKENCRKKNTLDSHIHTVPSPSKPKRKDILMDNKYTKEQASFQCCPWSTLKSHFRDRNTQRTTNCQCKLEAIWGHRQALVSLQRFNGLGASCELLAFLLVQRVWRASVIGCASASS